MAFTKILPAGINTGGSYTLQDLNVVGILTASSISGPLSGNATGLTGAPNIIVGVITASSAVITGDLTVQGTTTTLDTVLTEVDKLEVGANNTTVGVAITQSGTGDILRLYDSSTQVVTVTDGGSVGIGTDNPLSMLHLYSTGPQLRWTDSDNDSDSTIRYNGSLFIFEADSFNEIADSAFSFRVDGTNVANEKFAISSAGKVTITSGTNTGSANAGADNLVIKDNDGSGISILSGDGNSANVFLGSQSDEEIVRLEGFYNGGSPYFAAHTGGSEKVRITSSGNVGIGTDNPQNKLQVFLNAPLSIPSAGTSGHHATIGDVGFGVAVGALNSGKSYIQGTRWDGISANYDLLLQPNGGNIGIGTDNPSGQLTLYQTNNDVYASTTRNYEFLSIQNKSTTSGSRVGFELSVDGVGNASVANISAIDAGGGYTDLAIGLRNSDVFQEKVRITSAGNIGIGTDNPFSTNGTNLEVAHHTSSGACRLILRNTNGSGLRHYIQSQNDGALTFGDVSNGERLRITSEGIIRGNLIDSGSSVNIYPEFYRRITGFQSGNSVVNYLLLCTSSQPNVRLSGRITTARGPGTSACAAQLFDITFQTNHDGSHQSGAIMGLHSGSNGYGHTEAEIVTLTYNSTNYYAIRFGTGWTTDFDSCYFDGIASDNVLFTHISNLSETITNVSVLTADTYKGDVTIQQADLRISDGNIIMASGHGIDFSATSDSSGTMTSELLDDYEEGTFTPIVRGRTTAGTTTYSRTAVGKYVKIGRSVNVMIDVAFNSATGTGNIEFGGLPFQAHSGPYVRFSGSITLLVAGISWSNQLAPYINDGTSHFWITDTPTSGTFSFVNINSSSSEVLLNCTYMVS